ncbi:uncharacterized protein B0H64DRAFT_385506 [Chaetomium fimeti]|uniref:Uncharacterized protein n=1 Tax=Chaetomium fimeti TaxID=1854472 RepID=A0AAE0LV11_9PEZI|nr:hypothetical protein B0H64DRAFT_385506 [Chaetomium fimeti]
MGPKRNHNVITAGDDNESSYSSSNKRRREQKNPKPKQAEGKPDPTYGQRAAFPGLDDDESAQISDDDLEFEENGDALAYLRAVRKEASGVPNVLVAPKAGPEIPTHLQGSDAIDRSIYADGVGDSRGYYHDGAYTAAPDPDPSTASYPDEAEEGEILPIAEADRVAAQNAALRKAYFASLTARFLRLRALLHRAPPQSVIDALPRDHGTEVGSFGARSWTFRVWTRRIRHTDPLPAQVAALDRQSVLKLLRVILGGKFIRRGYELRPRTSRWIWALLARLPDQGELDYAEVGWVRELGKRAVLMMVSIAHMEALREEVEGGLEGDSDENDEEEFVEEVVLNEDGEERSIATSTSCQPPATADADDGKDQDGETDMDVDEGEVTDDEPPATADNKDIGADIAAAKARLLARLEESSGTQQEEESSAAASVDTPEHQQNDASDGETATLGEAEARVNMRATLNMVLTVAGEFYGQRDLLEFRDPFPAL